ncbi:MAG: hypothetical protein NT099_10120 [Candidatus Saganbacteria bacterium]|nr:hypothetical protein [Candidatus Saganbacteria bacterium]
MKKATWLLFFGLLVMAVMAMVGGCGSSSPSNTITTGTTTLTYIGGATEEGQSLKFATQAVTLESIFAFSGDIVNAGSIFKALTNEAGAGIQYVGTGELSSVTAAPASGYDWHSPYGDPYWSIAAGQLFCVKTREDKYVKIEVTSFENTASVTFNWAYQSSGSRDF